MRHLTFLITALSALFMLQPMPAVAVDCINATPMQHTFDSGASWAFCATLNEQHAMEISALHYQAPGDSSRQVLQQLHLGQLLLHYHDATEATALIGAADPASLIAVPLNNAVCTGELHSATTMNNAFCSEVQNTGLLAKYNMRRGLQGQQFRVFSVARYNGLTFQIGYGLSEDGRIAPYASLSGQPTRSSNNPDFGNALINPMSNAEIIGTQATLLYTWRMVFAMNGDGTDDSVEELNFNINPAAGNRRPMAVSQWQTETLRNTDRDQFRGWRIREPNGGGYYLDPQKSGYAFRDNTNNWAQFDLAITAYNECEQHSRMAGTESSTLAVNECEGSLDNFVNGESLVSKQPVLWYSLSREFRPSAEDYPIISSMLTEFELLPFDWTNTSPFEVIRE